MEGRAVQMVLEEKDVTISGGEESEARNTEAFKIQKRQLASYILSKRHRFYYFKLLFCELLNLANVALQLAIMNMFLGFSLFKLTQNLDILQLFMDKRPFDKSDALEQVFPKVTSCTFYSYGPSGGVINYQAVGLKNK